MSAPFLRTFLINYHRRLVMAALCLPYFHTWCGRSANLECMSEMSCTRLAGNTGRKKSPFWHHRTTLSQLRHVSTIEKQELIRRWDSERELFLQHRTCRSQRLRPL